MQVSKRQDHQIKFRENRLRTLFRRLNDVLRSMPLFLALVILGPLLNAQSPRNPELQKASPDENGVSLQKLQAMETAIRAGDFKKIGSVVVARHGKLLYEGYFDGDSGTLRDTRSATKSITDVLVGIAISEKKLSGVKTPV